MIERPRIKPHLTVEIAGAEQAFLLDETRAHVLEGRAYPKLLPLLDGERTTAEILDLLSADLSLQELFTAVATLERRGHLTDGWADGAGPGPAYWSRLNLSPAAVAERFASSPTRVRAVGASDAAPLDAALRAAGLEVVDDDRGVVEVVVTDDYLEPALDGLNREAIRRGRPWMLVRPSGTMLWIGPIFRPGRSACWACLRAVIEANRHIESFVERATGERPIKTGTAALPASAGVAYGLAASELARWVAAGESVRERSLLTFDLLALEFREHAVRRLHDCAACAGGDARVRRPPAPLALEPRPKRFTGDGGHRTVTPEETWQRVAPLVSPITGVATSLLRKDERENGLTFSYATGHAFADGSDLGAVQQNMRYRSGGKGMSDVQARVSGVCEAIERHSGVWRGTEYVVTATRHALGDGAIDLNAVLLFSASQYAERRSWNAGCSPTRYHMVPEPFDPNSEVAWTPLWSLTRRQTRYLPAAFCYYGHPDSARFFCAADANGTAAGNTLEEAILQGLLELIERDAIAIWWYNRVPRPAVDLASFDLPYVSSLLQHYRSMGRELWVLDLTHDLGVPVYAGVSRRVDRATEDVIVSFGAHLDPVVALTRALTETNQFLPALSRTRADGTTAYLYGDPDAIAWWNTATVANQPYVAADRHQPPRSRHDVPELSSSDITSDIELLTRRLAERGLEVLVLDQTRPDVNFPVARVVVPGLRHFWRRLAPGRLFDVPVALGWLPGAVPEADLNPASMFF